MTYVQNRRLFFVAVVYCFSFFMFASSVGAAPTDAGLLEKNKHLVMDFYNRAFNQHQPLEAAKLYLRENYIQHNPFVGTGRQAFMDFFSKKMPMASTSHSEIKRVVAEGNLVVLHVHSRRDEKDLGRAVVDIFRVENGKIAEHWDVAQSVPDKTANGNTMF